MRNSPGRRGFNGLISLPAEEVTAEHYPCRLHGFMKKLKVSLSEIFNER